MLLDGYVSKQELARQLGRSIRTIDRWETKRLGPPRVVVGRTVLYNIDSARKWLASREQGKAQRQQPYRRKHNDGKGV
jgi:DNA-binding transcriptional MerR regulator